MSEAMIIAGVGELAATSVERKTDGKNRQLLELAYGGLVTVGRVLPDSRANETEADQMGAVYAARASYDPRAAVTFRQKMMAQKSAAEKAGSALLHASPG